MNRERLRLALTAALCVSAALAADRNAKQTARDMFYREAGLIVSPEQKGKARFGSARKSVVAVTLGLKYRLWKLSGGQAVDADPDGAFQAGDQIRIGVEINDTGYLYIVQRQPGGQWRRVFPTPEIEHGNHFIHSGLTYPIPPEEGLELTFAAGEERFYMVLARSPIQALDGLVGPRQPENTVSAAPSPEVSDGVLGQVRSVFNTKDLLTETVSAEKAVYVVNRTGRPDSVVAAEIRLAGR